MRPPRIDSLFCFAFPMIGPIRIWFRRWRRYSERPLKRKSRVWLLGYPA